MIEPVAIGDFQLSVVSGGQLRIDGGNMFGVIPRAMWERKSPPDDQNRIRLATNCVLVRLPESLGIIDTGYGGDGSPRIRQRFALEDGEPLTQNLAAVGIAPDQVDWVILTHLHFDHAGGATRRAAGADILPVFPRARHFVQRQEWEDALSNPPELAGAYSPTTLAALERAGLIELVDGEAEIAPGVAVQLTGGHTRGHQIVRLQSAGQSAVCLGDICPTSAHLPTFWTMAYDQFPLTVRRIKPAMLQDAVDHDRIVLFSHDPHLAAARLMRDPESEWRAAALNAI